MLQSITTIPVLGVDASLNSLGYAYVKNGSLITGVIRPKKMKEAERLAYHHHAMADILSNVGKVKLVVMEGYAMGSGGRGNNNVFKIGELGGVLKLLFWREYNDLLIIPPKTLKLFVTGNGNADKAMMIEAVSAGYGIDFTGRDDEADAFGLMQMGEAYLSRRKPRIAHKLRALSKLEVIKGRVRS